MSTLTSPTADREIVQTRLLNAPRELVWKAWTDPKHANVWWGPNGFTNTNIEHDFRVGGKWRYIMHGPEGMEFPNRITFQEIVPPERLVYAHSSDVDDDPDAFHTTVTFEAVGDKTQLTMVGVFKTAAIREQLIREFNVIEGGKQHLDNLEAYLANMEAAA
jgi:uncharacterized protein YndB with AHSA1/START domain